MKQVRDNDSRLLSTERVGQQTLVSVNCVVLDEAGGICSLNFGKGDEIPILNEVVKIISASRVYQRVDIEQHCIDLPYCCNVVINGRLGDAGDG